MNLSMISLGTARGIPRDVLRAVCDALSTLGVRQSSLSSAAAAGTGADAALVCA